ncbi:MAG: hypothetical protein AAGE85_09825 [Pseudomonadota bacterium]
MLRFSGALSTAILLAAIAISPPAAADDELEAAIAREEEQREAMRSGMASIVDGVNSGSFALLAAAVNPDDMLERIFALRLIDQRIKKQYRESFPEMLESLIGQTIAQRQQKPVKARLLGFSSRENRGKAVVRYELENFQFSYHEYELTLDERDRLVVVDWTDFYWGERFSDGVGESLVIAAPGKSAVRKLIDIRNVSENQLFQATEALKAIRDFEVARYLEIVEGMDERLKQQRILVVGGVQMAKQARARRQLRTTLRTLAEVYPEDPLYTTLLLDFYFPTRQYEQARDALTRLGRRLEVDDAVLEARLSSTELVMRNAEAALVHAEKALALEDDLELAWWSALRARNATGDFAGAVEALTRLEGDFGYELEPDALAKDRSLARFLDSDEYSAWLAARAKPAE